MEPPPPPPPPLPLPSPSSSFPSSASPSSLLPLLLLDLSFLFSFSPSSSSLSFFSPSLSPLYVSVFPIGGLVVHSGVLFFVGLVYPYSRACNDDGPSPGAGPAAGKKKKGPPQVIKGAGCPSLLPPRLREYPRRYHFFLFAFFFLFLLFFVASFFASFFLCIFPSFFSPLLSLLCLLLSSSFLKSSVPPPALRCGSHGATPPTHCADVREPQGMDTPPPSASTGSRPSFYGFTASTRVSGYHSTHTRSTRRRRRLGCVFRDHYSAPGLERARDAFDKTKSIAYIWT